MTSGAADNPGRKGTNPASCAGIDGVQPSLLV